MLAKSGVCFFAVADVKLWYRSHRTILGKVYKKKSGQKRCQLTVRQKWVQTSLGFLKQHIVHRPQGSQLGHVLDEEDKSEPSASITHAPTKKKQKDVDIALLEFLQKTEKQTVDLATKMDAAIDQGSSEKQAWVDWMLQALRSLPNHIWRGFTKEAFALVQKYQEKAENEGATQQFAPTHMQQHVRQITSLMPIPPRNASLPPQWPQDPSQTHTQTYIQMHPSARWTDSGQSGHASTSLSANTSQDSMGSFNLTDFVAQANNTSILHVVLSCSFCAIYFYLFSFYFVN